MSGFIHHPEFSTLLKEAESLRTEVAQLLTEAHELVQVVRPNLLAQLQAKLGPWELKQLTAQCEVARFKRMISLAQAALNREQPIDWVAIDQQLDVEFVDWKTRISEAADAVKRAQGAHEVAMSPEEWVEFKKLYRALVKALHPDLHVDLSDAQKQLWNQVQQAYGDWDLTKIRALHASIHDPPEMSSSATAMEELASQVNSLRAHRERLRAEIEKMRSEPPFTLQNKLSNDTWIETRRAEIDTECAALANLRAQLQAHLQALAAYPANGTISGLN